MVPIWRRNVYGDKGLTTHEQSRTRRDRRRHRNGKGVNQMTILNRSEAIDEGETK
jgi:hypothetical protein